MMPRDPRSPAPDLSAINQPAGRAEARSGPATLSPPIQSIPLLQKLDVVRQLMVAQRLLTIAAGKWCHARVWYGFISAPVPNWSGELHDPHVVQKRLAPSVPPIVVRVSWLQWYAHVYPATA
jgi:hypothetical protein